MNSFANDQPIIINQLDDNFCMNGKKLNYYQNKPEKFSISNYVFPSESIKWVARRVVERAVRSIVSTFIPFPPNCTEDLVVYQCYIGDIDNFKKFSDTNWLKEWTKESSNLLLKHDIHEDMFLSVQSKIRDDIDLLKLIGQHNRELLFHAARQYLKQPKEVPHDMQFLTLGCNKESQNKPEESLNTSLPTPPKSIIFTDNTFMDYKAAALDSINIYNAKIADNILRIQKYQCAITELTRYLQENSETMQLVND